MKEKRLLLIASAIAAVVGVTLGVLALLPPRPGVTKENFDRIKEGMTRAEVEAIFGEPPNSRIWNIFEKGDGGLFEWDNAYSGDSARITLDGEGRVVTREWLDGWPDDRTFFQKMVDRLPWREKPAPRLRIVE
jgi:hypothetical protein